MVNLLILTLALLVCMGLGYYKLHIIVKSDILKIEALEAKNKQLKEDIFNAKTKLEVEKESLSFMKNEIEKYGSGAITESNSTKTLLGNVYHSTKEEYEKEYEKYVFKKKLLDNKREEFNSNQKELSKLNSEVLKLRLFK